MTSRKRQILAIVRRLLIENKVARPPVPVERIARKIGARIVVQSLEDDVSGFVYKDKAQSIIGVNTYILERGSALRLRMNLAIYCLRIGRGSMLTRETSY
jgi:hypothetical protein